MQERLIGLGVMNMFDLKEWQGEETDYVLGRLSAKTFEEIPHTLSPLVHAAMGLASEAGEYLDEVKKVAFGKKKLDYETTELMRNELSDVLFYWLFAAEYCDLSLEDAMKYLHQKLGGGHGW